MTDINLSELSTKELLELEKKIRAEKSVRGSQNKRDYGVHEKLFEIFDNNLEKKGICETSRMSTLAAMTRSVFKLCDITLDNYKLEKAKGKNAIGLRVNGQFIMLDDPTKYGSMCNDILDVVDKYAKKGEDNDREQED